MNRLETFCPLWPELDGDGLRATWAQQSLWAAQRETATRGSGGGKLNRRPASQRAAEGERGETDEAVRRNILWLEDGEDWEEETKSETHWDQQEWKIRGWKRVSDLADKEPRTARHGTAPPPSAEAPRSATLNLLFHAPRHKPPSRASINKQALCCSLSAWSVIIANGWGGEKRSDTGSRGEELPKYGLNQMVFHFQWELKTRTCRGLWVYWSLRSSCFLLLHAALNSFLLSA